MEYDREPPSQCAFKRSVIVYSIDKHYKHLIEVGNDSSTSKCIADFKRIYKFFVDTGDREVVVKCCNVMLDKRITRVPLSKYRFISLDYGWENYRILPVVHGYIYDRESVFNDIDNIDNESLRQELDKLVEMDINRVRYKGMDPEYLPDGRVLLKLPAV